MTPVLSVLNQHALLQKTRKTIRRDLLTFDSGKGNRRNLSVWISYLFGRVRLRVTWMTSGVLANGMESDNVDLAGCPVKGLHRSMQIHFKWSKDKPEKNTRVIPVSRKQCYIHICCYLSEIEIRRLIKDSAVTMLIVVNNTVR